MAKIDRVEELPEWFNLEKYRGAKFFGATEWFENLSYRREILQGNADYPDRDVSVTEDARQRNHRVWAGYAAQKAESLRQKPLIDLDESGIKRPSRWLGPNSHPVRNIDTADLIVQAHLDRLATEDKQCDPGLLERWAVINDPQTYYHYKSPEIARLPLELVNHFDLANEAPVKAAILVDLNTSDAVLKDAFEVWLKEVRAGQPIKTKKKKPLYDRWARYGILPYLDLLIWGLKTSTRIPDRVTAAAIMSRLDAGEDNLRKTIVPLAKDLMRDLSALEGLASLEAATRV